MMSMANSGVSNNRINDHFHYLYSCDVDDVNLRIKIVSLEGEPSLDERLLDCKYPQINQWDEVKISCQLVSSGKNWGPPFETSCRNPANRGSFNEWIRFPVKISDLPRDMELNLTFHGIESIIGRTKISIFNSKSCLRKGIYDLQVFESNQELPDDKCPTFGCRSSQVAEISKAMKKYESGFVKSVDWLDKLTFPVIERIKKEEKEASNQIFVSVEFPRFKIKETEFAIVYFEKEAEDFCHVNLDSDVIEIVDPELFLDNLIEIKHHMLSRNSRSGDHDRDLKPNPAIRDQLTNIINYPANTNLSLEEEDLIWKYRFYLLGSKKALAKFLKCINWDVKSEANQAIDLMTKWNPMDIDDALELLSPQFRHPAVRRYAVSRLKQAPDEDLLLYLLQLVQALKYESGNTNFGSEAIPSFAYNDISKPSQEMINDEAEDLSTFLIERSAANETLANYFYWYVLVELEEHKNSSSETSNENVLSSVFSEIMSRFSQRLAKGTVQERATRQMIQRQHKLVDELVKLMKLIAKEKGDRQEKAKKLQSLLCENDFFNFKSFEPLSLPLDPSVKVTGIVPEKALLFKSSRMPALLTFTTTTGDEYKVIMKYGDDLRQDQLILQTITLIDKLLKKENLDLKLTPYRVLATSSKHGFVQYIDSISVADVLKNHQEIVEFFKYHSNSKDGAINYDVIDTYVKSCAGYCIITYLLGVGDRHLDNLLLSKSGNLFHIDFGYILGRDPKPFPPPMKLNREMVEAMGGVKSRNYEEFKKLCYTAFLHLRRHSNLILNLFTLMVDATIPDVALEPDKAVKKVQDKFRLDLNDEAAVGHINTLLESSTTAVMANIVEGIHRWAQYWRK